ncbi:MAG TPA: coenzyme F420-0:L-glutamate ligase, partial [Actinomycetota bacterium]|nr:coenzyme F420-0:L-glutamate ligase [Actinomycetota bacterium]
GDLVVAETRHGFVCANAGVDASNVAEGFLSLLPQDPDRSAEGIRRALEAATGAAVAVVVTDTFGRPWRRGLVNVAVGAAGLPSLVDLRGTKDALGRVLDATVVALADEVAAASGLVMGKADAVPAALVRGVRFEQPPLPAAALVRAPGEDLFALSPLEAAAPRQAQAFGPGEVPPEALEEAARVALPPAPPGDAAPGERTLVVGLRSPAARRRLLAALRSADPSGGLPPGEAWVLGQAPLLVLPFLGEDAARVARDERSEGPLPSAGGDRERALLAGGAAVQRLTVALRSHRLATRWVPLPGARDVLREAVGVGPGWTGLGVLAVGPEPPEVPDLDSQPTPLTAPVVWR